MESKPREENPVSAADLTLAAFLDVLAAGEPTPGGGGAAALTGSQAAALLSMVIRFTVGRPKYAAVEAEMQQNLVRTEVLRQELLQLVDADADAFKGVAATYSMPKDTPEEKAARTQAMQNALKHATAVPFAVAEKCAEILHITAPVGAGGNPNVVSDAASALYLAYSAFQCAIVNVNINLKSIKDEAYLAAEWQHRDRLSSEARSAYQTAQAAIERTLGVAL